MNRMEKYFGEEYEFTPLSYMLPEEEDLLDEDMIKYKDMWYIAKPSSGRGGDGIFLVNRITDIPRWHSNSELLVQHYITDPLLVDKKKFDLRIYVLVKGLDPLECYFCTEGMARLCTENYKAPDRANRRIRYMHLTNFSVNKNSAKYVKGDDETGGNGNKRLLSRLLALLEKEQGIDPKKILDQIKDTIAKTIIGLIPYLADFARISINPNIDQLRCFQIFGFDVLIDKKLKAWLLEVNANPSLNMYLDKELPNGDLERTLCDLDKYLKSMVMQDAINIVKSKNSPDVYGCFERILPSKDSFYDQFYIWEEARKIFERLGGVKSPEFISSSQFQRLSKLRGMTNGKIVKASYDIMYKNVVNRSDSKLMAMEHFFDALEILAAKLFKKETLYESLNDLIHTVKDQHI